jgi:tRNA (adenine-N(1)-)-methyltransferase non-catalytic subunit
MGSSQIVVYSPYLQVLAEILQHAKKQVEYLNPTITESWSRTYQVLPGRTHPLMMTSGTGGYLFHATKIFPSTFQAESNQHFNRKKGRGGKAKSGVADGEDGEDEGEGDFDGGGEVELGGEVEEHDAIDEALDAEQEDIAMDN